MTINSLNQLDVAKKYVENIIATQMNILANEEIELDEELEGYINTVQSSAQNALEYIKEIICNENATMRQALIGQIEQYDAKVQELEDVITDAEAKKPAKKTTAAGKRPARKKATAKAQKK